MRAPERVVLWIVLIWLLVRPYVLDWHTLPFLGG